METNKHNVSLSKMIESYLDSVTEAGVSDSVEITPLVKSLSGVIQLDKEYDFKKDYANRRSGLQRKARSRKGGASPERL